MCFLHKIIQFYCNYETFKNLHGLITYENMVLYLCNPGEDVMKKERSYVWQEGKVYGCERCGNAA
jgi:predicted SprT family Zn-dependent metalloprotease